MGLAEIALQLVSFLLGILASFIAWFLVSKLLVPRLAISDSIVSIPSLVNPSNHLTKIQITNRSRFFDAYDVVLRGRFYVFGVNAENPDKSYSYVARVGTGNHPYIPKGSAENSRRFLVRGSKTSQEQLGQLYHIEDNVSVPKILSANPKNYLEITVISAHGYSGARKRITRRFTAENIQMIAPSATDSVLDAEDASD